MNMKKLGTFLAKGKVLFLTLCMMFAVAFGATTLGTVNASAAEVGSTVVTKTQTPPEDVPYGVWAQQGDAKVVCGKSEHTHGDGCIYLACDHYQRSLIGDPHTTTCYGEGATTWEVCPGGDHAHTASKDGYSVYLDSSLSFLWQPIYDAAVAEYRANNPKPSGFLAGIKYEAAVVAYANEAVQNTTFCYTTTTPLICGHGDTCTDACCSREAHTHDASETGCYEYTWELKADVNDNNIIDGAEEDPYYTVTLTDGVEGVEVFADQDYQVVKDGEGNFMLPDVKPEREGYNFKGFEVVEGEETIFQAIWEIQTYKITWLDGDGKELEVDEAVEYGAMPEYNGATPTKKQTAAETFTFNGTWSPAIVPANGEATYTAQFDGTVRTYTVSWDTNGDGEIEYTEQLAYGTLPEEAKPADHPEDKHFAGWIPHEVRPVSGDVTYTATYSDDVIYTVVFTDKGAIYPYISYTMNITANPEWVIKDPGDPVKDGYIFAGWDKDVIGKVPKSHLVVYAQWDADQNRNNVADKKETVTITVNVTGEGNVALLFAVADELVTDNGDGTYSVVIDSKNDATRAVQVKATPKDTNGEDGAIGYVVSAPKAITLADGENVIEAVFAEHKINAVENPSVKVNGYADKRVDELTKKAVLEALLGTALTDEEIGEYKVEMLINIKGLEGYFDIWELLANDTSAEFRAALNEEINVGGAESFKITWNKEGYPIVSGKYSVQIAESREETVVTHNGNTYKAGAWSEELAALIMADLSSNTNIVGIERVDNGTEFIPGQPWNITIKVTVEETEEFYGTTHELEIGIQKGSVTINETADLEYNPSMANMPTENKVALVFDAIEPQFIPEITTGEEYIIWYRATEARTVDVVLDLKQMGYGWIAAIVGDTITLPIPVGELWLRIDDNIVIPEQPSNERMKEIFDEITGLLLSLKFSEAGKVFANNPDVAEYYKYLGAHYFGELEQETVRVTVEYAELDLAVSNNCTLTIVDARAEAELRLNEGVTVGYAGYTEEELMNRLVDGVYVNGEKVDVDPTTLKFAKSVIGLPASDATEIVVNFKGDEYYKPATATATITIRKASVSISVDNQFVKYGEEFNKLPVTTAPSGVATIQFIAGIDLANLNIDGGIKGYVGKVQLLLPENIKELLATLDGLADLMGWDINLEDGATIKLSDLKGLLDLLDGYTEGKEYAEYLNLLFKVLENLPTEVADLEITLGGELPTNIGAYVIGAVTADANYELAVGVGVLAIYPDAIKANIEWNQNDDNYVITNTLFDSGAFDAEAHAVTVGAGGNLEEATAQIVELFIGIDIEGNFTLETSAANLKLGAYLEVAMIVNWGNEMYYSNVLARPVMVVAETLNVDFGDSNGNINNERHFEFDNCQKDEMANNLIVTYKDGTPVDLSKCSIRFVYVGMQTNGQYYASSEAPVHSGVYTITCIIVMRDENGAITHAGQGIGVLAIEPSKAEINVENESITWDGEEHKIGGFITSSSVNVPELPVDVTIISAGVSADLDKPNAISAINGTVNIDFPVWMDETLAKLNILQEGYTGKISVADFLSRVEGLEEALNELGMDNEVLMEVINFVKQLSVATSLTFQDDMGYSEVGAYLVVGIVTDANHYPILDAGVVIIHPQTTGAILHWAYEDSNNIFTLDSINGNDMGAYATVDGIVSDDVIVEILYLGVDVQNFKVVATHDKTELMAGSYLEFAYVLGVDNTMYAATPIVRNIIVVTNQYDIDVEDTEVHENGSSQGITVDTIINQTEENIIDKGELTIVYTDINNPSNTSTTAPTAPGEYVATITFITYDDEGMPTGQGVKLVRFTITAHDYEATVTDPTCTEQGYTTYVCKDCGDTYVSDYVDATGHADDAKDTDHECDACGERLNDCLDDDKNHNCDICGEKLSDCVDEDKDHDCDYDGCKEFIGVCEDKDTDHVCDYGCDKVYGTCEDKDTDHVCDYGCDKVYGTCEDKDTDHVCDYGCDKVYGTCEDKNTDHVCDYGCDKVYGTCEDADKDHTCDYGCGKDYGVCEDKDTDHVCDYGCDKVYGVCEDKDTNHVCDYGCDKVYGVCEDVDKDHTCDYGCGKDYGLCEDKDTDHVCDYGCDKVYGVCEDKDTDHVCDYGCDKVYGTCEDKNTDHVCDYGCDKAYGTCEDVDKDHTCDYGCGKDYGVCEDKNTDHVCDYGCEKGYGVCEDVNKDHTCDYGCGKEYGTCEDADKDHTCDYGCGKEYGTCEDVNKDHTCDYGCGKEYGTCEDADKDHTCDYGCGKEYGTCEDVNKDHTCDYGCGKEYGTCEDADKDHTCDYGCGKEYGTCEDADKDHTCDYGCGKEYGTCEDADKDHTCDYGCGKEYGTCEDADKDHTCDYGCGKEYGKHADSATDEDHVCDYGCGEVIEECLDDNHDHHCDVCDKVISECTDADDHKCDICGEVISECIDEDENHRCDICKKREKDERVGLIIALIISSLILVAVVVAIYFYNKNNYNNGPTNTPTANNGTSEFEGTVSGWIGTKCLGGLIVLGSIIVGLLAFTFIAFICAGSLESLLYLEIADLTENWIMTSIGGVVFLACLLFGLSWANIITATWMAKHTTLYGKRLIFKGTLAQLYGKQVTWFALSVVTAFIYSIWVPLKKKQWIAEHTEFEGNKNTVNPNYMMPPAYTQSPAGTTANKKQK